MIDAPHFVAYVFVNKAGCADAPMTSGEKGAGDHNDLHMRRALAELLSIGARVRPELSDCSESSTLNGSGFFRRRRACPKRSAFSVNPFANFGDGADGQVPGDRSFVEIADRAG
jgi:hypothetical protein